MNTFFGIKQSLTQTWNSAGKRLPATIIKTTPLTVTQVKSAGSDGYSALQVGFGSKSRQNISKPLLSHLEKAYPEAAKKSPRTLREIKESGLSEVKIGAVINLTDVLAVGDRVAVAALSRGRGFAGVVKRWGFKGGPRAHGQSDRERAPGAIGQGTSPGRIHKGKRMAGHFGFKQFTVKNLTVIKVDADNQELWVSGPIPGSRGSLVRIKKL